MNINNFKAQTNEKIVTELAAWNNGEKVWNVSNQFDESVLESALINFEKMDNENWKWWANSSAGLMELAHALSEFEAPEMDSTWID